jgi:hypothetical protein
MKKLLAVALLVLSVSATSFGAEHTVTRSAKIAGKDSAKAAEYAAVKVGHASRAVAKFLF